MASLWLMLFSMSLLYLNSIAKPTLNQESEFECVPIYKQSALQHPLMKNHRIQMKPSRELLSILSTSNGDTIVDLFSTSEECPKGHIPIHKPKTDLTNDLIIKAGRFLSENNGDEKGKKNENNGGEKEKKNENNGGEKEKKEENNGGEKEKKNKNNGGEKEKKDENNGGEKKKKEENNGGEKEKKEENNGGEKKKKEENKGGEKEKKEENNGGEKEKKEENNGGEKEKKKENKEGEKEKKKENNGGEKEKKEENNGGENEKKNENNGGEKRRKNNLHSEDKNKNSPKLKIPNHPPKTFDETHLHYAVIKTNTSQKWRGAQAVFNIKEPHGVGENQFSKAWVWLNYGKGEVINSIQFGWAVHTELYRDTHPRLTTYWQSDKETKGCYNALCKGAGGYVQVHKSIYPGLMYDEKKNKTVHLSVAEDPKTKNWVLAIGEEMIGYWPHQTYMAEGASELYFGGLAGSASSQTISPPMGNGDFPTKDLNKSCFMNQLKQVLPDYSVEDINSTQMVEYVDNRDCYGVMFLKYVDYDNRETLTFGGPGGYCRK